MSRNLQNAVTGIIPAMYRQKNEERTFYLGRNSRALENNIIIQYVSILGRRISRVPFFQAPMRYEIT